ncbi:hypothetical protein C7U92_05580 [Bradyrhizobium sp. WBOS7]|uniref:Uncharacterized protein n=1 Tax=Bradyrhizobium betae TaxID=244734 RepID=A0AAE9SRN1_9BRAD|nr:MULTISPECIES: hypothetical protein [Bradyrhizobium]MDD1569087.1 hypothetical protein [Bradyrhizobium sp. WBOS1]UUO37899.1 hypothetical protein DCK84_27190 [Bradyrhizobium sp. WBOS01]MDD1527138.1 hypothetical protein [Bradyrhizobium sp. WBOS2]MDD1576206.1 hypothetical protein [Bradyrhizobium sp. WBOS7]MDD1602460.1 hypothetical protein [Bradyrhizobium sp. WBOS16]
MRRLIILGAAFAAAIIVEEATLGGVLGQSPSACRAMGGKPAPAAGRCVMPVCYWLGNCGHWAYPPQWLDRLKPGDKVSKVVFWLGEPLQRDGEYLSWSCGKAYADSFRVVIRDKRLVAIEPCKSD